MTNPEGKLPATLAEVQHPLVGVIMGSDSDLEVVVPAIDVLSDFSHCPNTIILFISYSSSKYALNRTAHSSFLFKDTHKGVPPPTIIAHYL